MVRLPRIAIGTQKRKNYFDLSHDVSTTADFGFCQPTIVRHMNAGSSSRLKTSVGVRLAPLPCPTFGRIRLKTYNTLVPIQEVFEAYDYFQKQTSINSLQRSYIPTEAPYINAFMLRDFINIISLHEFVKMFDTNVGDIKNVDCDALVNFSIMTPSFLASNVVYTGNQVDGKNVYRFIDNTFVPCGSFLRYDFPINDAENHIPHELWFLFKDALYEDGYIGSNGSYHFVDNSSELWNMAGLDMDQFYSFRVPFAGFSGERDDKIDSVRQAFYFNRGSSSAYDIYWGSSSVQLEFVDDNDNDCIIEVPFALYSNWTKRGQRLFKVLNAIGLRGFVYNDNVDLCKFFAYYKAWFDNLNPGRSIQWRETSCYKLIHTFYDLGTQIKDLLNGTDSQFVDSSDVRDTFVQFLIDVTNCCYVLPIDNFTAATPDNLEQVGSTGHIELGTGAVVYGGNDDDNYPHLNVSEHTNLDGLAITALVRLYKLANKNSMIGARIEDYLKTKFGYTIEKSAILKGSEQVIRIDEIFATAGTSDNYLGEIGGRGATNNAQSDVVKFDCDKPSIFVQFMAIVPYGDYVQGNVKAKVVRNDFYQEVYDSVGKEGLSMSEIMARSSDGTYHPNLASFGKVPLFWRDKVQNSMHNGAFALPSQRANIIPYSLDRLFNETKMRIKVDANGIPRFVREDGTVLTPSEELRYIGRTPDYGNYDRIFFDNNGYFDNFILHIVEDWDYYATMKPISQSFETFDDDNDDSTTSITAS